MSLEDQPPPSLADVFADDPVSAALAKIINSLQPGERLPSERELAIQLDVSRTALRDRLGVLEGLGILRRRTGSGTFVEQLKPDALALALNLAISASHLPLESLESVRIALERQAAAEAARKADPVLIAYMRRAVDEMASDGSPSEILDADRAFHQSLLRAAGNPALSFFAEALSDVLTQDLQVRTAALESLAVPASARDLMVNHHRSICDAVVSGDPLAAMSAVNAHFDALHKNS